LLLVCRRSTFRLLNIDSLLAFSARRAEVFTLIVADRLVLLVEFHDDLSFWG